MPTPSTAKWPKPRSEDEFEDIVVDFVRLRWADPNAARNGRRGQRQHGVDILGHPEWLKGRTAAAQCKNTELLSLKTVKAEITNAAGFPGGLAEFYIVTSADRDAALNADVREHLRANPCPFDVQILFWPDIVADLAGHDELVAKHWKGFSESTPLRKEPAPAPRQLDRQGVNADEADEYQCEFAIWLPEPQPDIESSESEAQAGRVDASVLPSPIFKALLGTRPVREHEATRWALRQRRAANLVEKWELELGRGGRLAYRWARFTTGGTRLFDVGSLLDGVLVSLRLHAAIIKGIGASNGIDSPGLIHTRMAVHGNGPLVLHDEAQLATFSMSTREAPPDWVIATDVKPNPVLPAGLRILNRAVAKFGSGSTPVPQIDEARLRLLLERLAPLD